MNKKAVVNKCLLRGKQAVVNKCLLRGKQADQRVLSIYLFVIYIIVAIGIVSGVILFYGKSLDVRSVEADLLSKKVVDCLVVQGKLKGEVLEEGFKLDECNFYFKDNTQRYQGRLVYGMKVGIYDFESEEKIKEFSKGDLESLELCFSEGGTNCDKTEIYVWSEKEEKVLIKIISGVSKVENV